MIRSLFLAVLFFVPAGCLDAAELESCPRIVETADEAGLFRRRPPRTPDSPKQPEAPQEPPKFVFPDAESEQSDDETEQAEPTEEQKRLLREAGIEDWTKEDWQKLIEMIMYIISLFAGGGLGARVRRV